MDKLINEPFVLGTAQLGMNYGVANRKGKPDFELAEALIKIAWEKGIREFDTAQVYGESEKILGVVLKKMGVLNNAKIITKPNPLINYNNPKIIEKSIETSLNNIGDNSLYCYMLHDEDLLEFWEKDLGRILLSLVNKKIVRNIGISVYSPLKALEALQKDSINFVQIPSNILDRRFEDYGVFELAKENNKTIYIRSIYLQGLTVMNIKALPKNMEFARPILQEVEKLAKELNISKQELSLAYAKIAYKGSKIVLGMENIKQLLMNIDILNKEFPSEIVNKVKLNFSNVDEKIINPTLW